MSVQVGEFGFVNVTTNQPIQAGSSASVSSSNTAIATVSNPNPSLTAGTSSFRAQIQGQSPGNCTMNVNFTNPDGTTASGSATQTVVAAPAPDVTSLTVTAA